ncbi:alpha/beta hydrolase [Arthrobacter tumbae]|uniref:alpha/beta hydrolase n=1 Tax=Arthrobacter tumbae TaxID=163874 RepID=UPI00195A447B|nr:alpha/beta hydrolase [Arthrobacter tumbae]MBM7783164.1 alpha-beta hydrolase superfamily lysophospholipase [Arthrobacter tumbae]
MGINWQPDHLGDGFALTELHLGADEEGPCVATLISYTPPAVAAPAGLRSTARAALKRLRERNRPASAVRAVLYLHGWSDYFFQHELAHFFSDRGIAFYALDLRKYGRSLRPWQTPGYVTDLSEYDDDIAAALKTLAEDIAARTGMPPSGITLMAHSTGALVASLWADRFPGRVSSLILNSPWLDIQGSAILRTTTQGLLEPITRFRPKARLKLPEFGFYWRSISNLADGEWELNGQWRPQFGFPIRAGWLTAVLSGHAHVRRGLSIDIPVLVLSSSRSTISPVWNEAMLSSDSVLDVTVMTQRALQLGPHVTVCRFEGALHDTLLSPQPVRRKVYAELDRWVSCYSRSLPLPDV